MLYTSLCYIHHYACCTEDTYPLRSVKILKHFKISKRHVPLVLIIFSGCEEIIV